MGATLAMVWAPPLPQRSLRDPAGVGPNNKHWVPGVSFLMGWVLAGKLSASPPPGLRPRGFAPGVGGINTGAVVGLCPTWNLCRFAAPFSAIQSQSKIWPTG